MIAPQWMTTATSEFTSEELESVIKYNCDKRRSNYFRDSLTSCLPDREGDGHDAGARRRHPEHDADERLHGCTLLIEWRRALCRRRDGLACGLCRGRGQAHHRALREGRRYLSGRYFSPQRSLR